MSRSGLQPASTLLAIVVVAATPLVSRAGETRSVLSGRVLEGASAVDPRGMTTWSPHRRRTPSGFLYPFPLRPMPYRGDDVLLRGYAELGWLFSRGDEDEARFREYGDYGDGWWIRRFALEGRTRDGLGYARAEGGSVARNDSFYRAEVGRTNFLRVRGSYDALDHTYLDEARVLHSGVGGEQLRLPPSLVPGANTGAEVEAALSTVGRRRISQSRNESAVELRVRLRPDLVWLGRYRLDRRDGERPFGGTLGLTFGSTNSGSVVETLEPIHSRTHDWSTALEYTSPRVQANLRYRASLYDNRRESLTWENPFAASDLGFLLVPGEPLGRAALPPDNHSHQVSADLAARLPFDGRFTTSVAWTRMRQDERLLPATINSDLGVFQDLSRSRADARVDTLLLRSSLRVRPLRPLALQMNLRFFERDNDTRYVALDRETGVYGYVVEDLAPTDRVGSVPFSHRRWSVEGSGQWRLSEKSNVGVEIEHEEIRRARRARRETRNDRFRVHLSTRAVEITTLRIAYAYERQSGSHYDPTRDRKFYEPFPGSGVLAGPARSLRTFRQFDLARYQGHEVDLRSNWLIGESADLAFTARLLDRDYGSDYGITDERLAEVGVDAAYLPSPMLDLRVFGRVEWRDRRMVTINSAPGPPSDLTPGGSSFPLANRWSWSSAIHTFAAGAGLTFRPLEGLELELDYQFQRSTEDTDTDFDRSGGALSGATDPATAPASYSGQSTTDHLFQASLTRRWAESIATTVLYRLQKSDIEELQQRGLEPVVNQNLYLAGLDDDYTVHLVGLTTTLSF